MVKTNTITLGKKDVTVTTAGTAVAILDSGDADYANRKTPDVIIYNNNATGDIYVGDSTVDDTFVPIAPGNSFSLTHGTGSMGTFLSADSELVFDLSELYIDADTDGMTAIVQYTKIKEV